MRSSLKVTAGMILLGEEIGADGIPGRAVGKPTTGSFGAKVIMTGGLYRPTGKCSVATGRLPRSSEST